MLGLEQIVFAALLALFVTWFIRMSYGMLKIIVTGFTELSYQPRDLESIMKKCHVLFPIESVRFNGDTFRRGMSVRVVTAQNRTIEGKFVGTNHDNIVCFLTADFVVAQELDQIEEIYELCEGE
jgi:hypothetical protein